MTTAIGLHIREILLGNSITSTELNTLLGNSIYLASYKSILNTKSSLKSILNDANAINIMLGSQIASDIFWSLDDATDLLLNYDNPVYFLIQSSDALRKMVNNQDALSKINASITIRDRFNSHINQSYSKLMRQVFTASGTFTYTDTILEMSLFGSGSGANGGNGVAGNDGEGGGAGEIKTLQLTSSFPSSGSTVTIANETATTLGAAISCASPTNATETLTSDGAGTTAGDIITTYKSGVINNDIVNNIWNYGNFALKGGNGGRTSGSVNATVSSSLLGTAGSNSNGTDTPAYGGSGLGAGGGYGAGATISSTSLTNGQGYGCGGGGGSNGGSGTTTGGTGSTGIISVCYIR